MSSSSLVRRRRADVEIQKISPSECVVKLAADRQYFSLGPQEAYLLRQLNGHRSGRRIREKYEEKFGERLSRSDLKEFIAAVESMGLLEPIEVSETPVDSNSAAAVAGGTDSPGDSSSTAAEPKVAKKRKGQLFGQSALFFRVPLFDPDRLFNALEPRLRWLWSRTFCVMAITAMFFALVISIANSQQLIQAYPALLDWKIAALFAVVLVGATALHEMAHGLTCKHFGGEVHETGLLFMFFIPCMYCNVSDAWLIPENRKRLLITLAGGFLDLCVWALSVFVWRVTVPGLVVNQIALVVLTVTGTRSFLNFNPLLRLDGYYLLADWLAIPNLRIRGKQYWMAHVRWMLWGAARPRPVSQGRILMTYGFLYWAFAIGFLNVIVIQFFQYLSSEFGFAGLAFIGLLLMFGLRRVFKGFFESELTKMIKTRPGRTGIWAAGIGIVLMLMFGVPVRSISSGDFEVRPGQVIQQHVAVAGIVDEILVDDGDRVTQGEILARLRSPDLLAQIRITEDMLREVNANLKRLEAGTRPEEIKAQQQRVAHLEEWRLRGKEDLQQAQLAHEQELLIQEHRVRQAEATLEFSRQNYARSYRLYEQGALAGAQLRAEYMNVMSAESGYAREKATQTSLAATGLRSRESELAKREQELAEAQQTLRLLEAGSRPEDITAERARSERIAHDLEYLREQEAKLQIVATADGILSAPRLREKIGQAIPKDAVFCTIENPKTSCVEISVSEDDAAHVKPGLPVTLKARAIPFETFTARVEGISAVATKLETSPQNVVVVRCQIENPDGRLKSGMTGFGRIQRGSKSMGMIAVSKAMKYFRTEFWW